MMIIITPTATTIPISLHRTIKEGIEINFEPTIFKYSILETSLTSKKEN